MSNKAGRPAAERLEGRRRAEWNTPQAEALRTQSRASVQAALGRVRQAAERKEGERFTALLHHIYAIETLRAAFYELERDAVPGVDGQRWSDYGQGLEANLAELTERVRRGAYWPQPVRRAYVPKRDGQQRPIGITAVEDKVVQRATAKVLSAVYEAEFAGFSYGARPGRTAHQALAALDQAIMTRPINWVLDADLRNFFGSLDQQRLVQLIEERIGDKRVVRLIRRWLAAGVLEDGTWTRAETGTEQGGSISPLLANVYLHYVFDVWVNAWRRREAQGEMIVVRYLDDFIVGFQRRADADAFLGALRERLGEYGLELHPDKTRLLEFGRHAAEDRQGRGQGKPESFEFLGMVHSCGRTRQGRFTVRRQTSGRRMRAKLHEVKAELRRRWHDPLPEVGRWLGAVVRGYYQYHGIAGNARSIRRFREHVVRLWHRALGRRSQKGQVKWTRMQRLIEGYIPRAHIVHPWPRVTFAVMTQGKSPVR